MGIEPSGRVGNKLCRQECRAIRPLWGCALVLTACGGGGGGRHPATSTFSGRHDSARHDAFCETRRGDRVRQRNIHRLFHRSRDRCSRPASTAVHMQLSRPPSRSSNLAQGARTVNMRARDAAGNVDAFTRGHSRETVDTLIPAYDAGELAGAAFQFHERHVLVQLE